VILSKLAIFKNDRGYLSYKVTQ